MRRVAGTMNLECVDNRWVETEDSSRVVVNVEPDTAFQLRLACGTRYVLAATAFQ
jgi:hypothetical protein